MESHNCCGGQWLHQAWTLQDIEGSVLAGGPFPTTFQNDVINAAKHCHRPTSCDRNPDRNLNQTVSEIKGQGSGPFPTRHQSQSDVTNLKPGSLNTGLLWPARTRVSFQWRTVYLITGYQIWNICEWDKQHVRVWKVFTKTFYRRSLSGDNECCGNFAQRHVWNILVQLIMRCSRWSVANVHLMGCKTKRAWRVQEALPKSDANLSQMSNSTFCA